MPELENHNLENILAETKKHGIQWLRRCFKKVLQYMLIASLSYSIEREHITAKIEEKKAIIERLQQRSFYKDYGKNPLLYGDRLYTNEELLNLDFQPMLSWGPYFDLKPETRMIHFFLRNGKEAVFQYAEYLGGKHQKTLLDEHHSLTRLFEDAGIDILGEYIDYIEVVEGRNGGISRDASKYSGNNESLILIAPLATTYNNPQEKHAAEVGYAVDTKNEFTGILANELSHEIQNQYFPTLFSANDFQRLDEPFASFVSEIPGLYFQNNAQAAEFLSDVADWDAGGRYFRFFNSLDYMLRTDKEARYWYTYQVQQYAMKKILAAKGIQNSDAILEKILNQFHADHYGKDQQVYGFVHQYFQEADFDTIAKIYREIGVKLLHTMKPYYKK